MTEEIWFILIFWIVTILIGVKYKSQYFKGVGALVGIFLGFIVITDVYIWFGIILIFTSLYLLYSSLFQQTPSGGKKKK